MKAIPALVAAVALASLASAAEPKKLLLVTVTSGFVHAAIPIQEQMIREMAKTSGDFTIISTSDSPNYPGAEYRSTIDQRNARIPREGAPDNRMTAEQVLATAAGGPAAGRGAGGGGRGAAAPTAFPGQATGATPAQQAALTAVGPAIVGLVTEANAARTALTTASLAASGPGLAAELQTMAAALAAAEQKLAAARAEAIARIQATPDRLSAAQLLSLSGAAPAGGRGGARGGAPATPAGGMTLAEKNAAVLKEYLSPEALKKYDGVAFLSTVGELPIPDREAFFKWVADGHAFIGLHAAADTLHQTPEYIKMLGAEFTQHGSHSEVAVVNLDPASPLTAGWQSGIKITEEWYNFRNYDRSQVHILLAMENHPTNGTPGHYPVSWIKSYGTGRVFYTSLGHRDDVIDPKADMGDAEFKVRYNAPATALMVQKHILSGIRWALGLVQADATVGTR
jgi:type 1 glutamine amidotransferase